LWWSAGFYQAGAPVPGRILGLRQICIEKWTIDLQSVPDSSQISPKAKKNDHQPALGMDLMVIFPPS